MIGENLYSDNVRVIVGPPGTGKTTHIAAKAEEAASLYGAGQVVVASLTKAAAAEASGRIDLPKGNVGTLHALCYRQLGCPGVATDHADIEEFNSRNTLFRVEGMGDDDKDDPGYEIKSKYGEYQLLRARRTPIESWTSDFVKFHTNWTEWKRERDVIDFQDMIDICIESGEPAPGNPAYIMVDEAQDCSKAEFTLIRDVWAKHARGVVLVGDGDQSLYEWRGAKASDLTKDIPLEHIRVLDQSYRVPRKIVAHASEWISRCRERFATSYRPRDADGTLGSCAGSTRNPEPIIKQAEELAKQGQTVMILATCDYMLNATIAVLRQWGIPFHNPYRRKNGRWNPLGSRKGVSAADRMLAFLDCGKEGWEADQLDKWTEHIESKKLLRHGGKADLETEMKCEPERRSPAATLAGIFADDRFEEALAASRRKDVAWLQSQLLWKKSKVYEFPACVYRNGGESALRDTPKITVGTCHSVKGGEASNVFLFPDLSRAGQNEWDGINSDSVRRTFYVGMTRAKESLFLCESSGPQAVNF